MINLTPHAILEVTTGRIFAPSGAVVRVKTVREQVYTEKGIPFFRVEFGAVEGMPALQGGEVYIVSAMAKEAIRTQLADIFPNEEGEALPIFVSPGELVRDDKGQPIGCKGFDA